MKQLISESKVPPGGVYRYVDKDAGFHVEHPFFFVLKSKVRDERLKRGLPVGTNFDQDVVDTICTQQPHICVDPPTLTEKATSLVKSLARMAMAGFKTVTEEGYHHRHAKCTPCVHFRGLRNGIHVSCAKCGCTRLKLLLATEHCPIDLW